MKLIMMQIITVLYYNIYYYIKIIVLQEQPNFKLLMDLLAGSIAGAKSLQTQVSYAGLCPNQKKKKKK